jgi:hypothetical protein
MHIMRDLLDTQLVDKDDEYLGRVDGIVAEIREGEPPRVLQFELGFVTIARRIHPRLEPLAEAMHRRWSVRRSARFHVPWSGVIDVDVHRVRVDVRGEETPALDWERWLRRHIIGRIPGSSDDE